MSLKPAPPAVDVEALPPEPAVTAPELNDVFVPAPPAGIETGMDLFTIKVALVLEVNCPPPPPFPPIVEF